MSTKDEKEIERLMANQLQTITSDCEVCGTPVAKHSWADVDITGNIVHCSVKAFEERVNRDA